MRLEMLKTIIVLVAWGLTVLFFPWHWFGRSFVADLIPYYGTKIQVNAVSFWWLCTFFASFATALALGLKHTFLALPGLLFPPFTFLMATFSAKYSDVRPIYLSLPFFFFFATCMPLLIRSYKDEKKQRKIYQGSLLLMVFLVGIFLRVL
jgi:hypothetical protein